MICGFYSLRRDMGRTMTLANVGRLLSDVGLRVLLFDFDLDDPALYKYCPPELKVVERPGVVDLIRYYQQALMDRELPTRAGALDAVINLNDFLLPLDGSNLGEGCLSVLHAGRHEGYRARVAQLDWHDFYDRWEGELFFRWLRRRLGAEFDVTLVDIASGHQVIADIARYDIADVVISLCSPKHVDELATQMRQLVSDEVAQRRDSQVIAIAVPGRTELNELEAVRTYYKRFSDAFGAMLPKDLSVSDLWRAGIPNVPFFSSREGVLLERNEIGVEALADAYRRVARIISRMAPRDSRLSRVDQYLQARD